MSAYVAGFFGFLGWVFRVICPFWVWGVSGHLSVFWLVGFVGVDGVFGDDFSGVFVDDEACWVLFRFLYWGQLADPCLIIHIDDVGWSVVSERFV